MQIEKNYDFRKRMQEIHKTGLRNDTLVLSACSLCVGDTLVVQTEYNTLLLRVVSITENM